MKEVEKEANLIAANYSSELFFTVKHSRSLLLPTIEKTNFVNFISVCFCIFYSFFLTKSRVFPVFALNICFVCLFFLGGNLVCAIERRRR